MEWNPHHAKKYGCLEGMSKRECNKYAYGTWRAVVTQDDWKLVQSCGDVDNGLLFDLNEDPWEMNNLYGNKKYEERKQVLLGLLANWQVAVEDTVPLVQ